MYGQITSTVGGYLPKLVAALAILVVGWLVALVVSAVIRKILVRTTIDDRIAAWAGIGKDKTDFQIEQILSKGSFYLVMLFVFVAFFQALGLTIITQPLNNLLNKIFSFMPQILGASVLLAIAWLLATALKFIVSKALGATQLDDKLSSQAGLTEKEQVPLSETLANIVYWFVFLLFLPAILDALQMQGLLKPVQTMLDDLLGYLPNLLGAAIILVVGWFIARIIRQIITGLLVAAGADGLGRRVGIGTVVGGQKLSGIIGNVVYALVFIQVVIAALNALAIQAISGPATTMLTTLLNAIPSIFGAMIVLSATYFIGKLVAGLVTNLLTTIGFNQVLKLIGLGKEPEVGQRTPAEVVGYLVMVGLMLFATTEAANMLGFTILADLVKEFLNFAGQVILGVVIFGLGLYLANLARSVILNTAGSQAVFLSQVARLAIIVLTTAMALRRMGIADDIVNLAFGLLLGAIAIAVALAFGLGSRDIAAREVESLLTQFRGSTSDLTKK